MAPAVDGLDPGQTVVAGFFLLNETSLSRLVPEFNKFLVDNRFIEPGFTAEKGSALWGTRMVARWRNVFPSTLHLSTPQSMVVHVWPTSAIPATASTLSSMHFPTIPSFRCVHEVQIIDPFGYSVPCSEGCMLAIGNYTGTIGYTLLMDMVALFEI
ncbi:hypothetical protein BU17DRAFT_66459 [Hysterangium stoloniferum]|nr:hypothetical protein BU17DRAFT_66459 [Hysterangium stoloniferum]